MNCIIVDDDSFIRKITEDFVRKTESLTLLHSLSSAMEAINVLNSSESIDLIFLDIEMPEMTGIEFLCSLTKLPQIVIISSKESYAINAFEFDVTDYLLKPFTYSRFCKAVNKVIERHKSKIHHAIGGDEIFIKHGQTLVKLRYSDILWIEAMENYIVINTFEDKYTMHFTMRAIEEKIPTKQFLRVHRSYIINIGGIHSIGEKVVNIITKGPSINNVPIGKMYKNNLLKELNVIARK